MIRYCQVCREDVEDSNHVCPGHPTEKINVNGAKDSFAEADRLLNAGREVIRKANDNASPYQLALGHVYVADALVCVGAGFTKLLEAFLESRK